MFREGLRKVNRLGLFLVFMALTRIACAQDIWKRLEIVTGVSGVRSVALDAKNPGVIYASGEEGVYKTIDGGKSWRLSGTGLIKEVNFIYIDRNDSDIVYAAASGGLFLSQDAGVSWQRIFLGKDDLEREVTSIEVISAPPRCVFIGTRSGVFFSPANRIIWQKISGKLNDASINFIISDPRNPEGLFVVSSKGLFKSENRLSSHERLYSGFNPEPEDPSDDAQVSEENPYLDESLFKHLAFDRDDSDKLYLSGREGLFSSDSSGKSWQKRIFSGLPDEDINYALIGRGRIFLAVQNGVFECAGDFCKQLYRGADFNNCGQLALDSGGNLYSACDRGLYIMPVSENKKARAIKPDDSGLEGSQDAVLLRREPGIREIQQEAIKYAEVYPEKISNWRKQARLKAFLPELDLTYDKTVFTSTSFPQGRGFVGPLDWGVSLSWDLGDLIFSTEQTSIDARSRLMVQLRDDILDEVTRLYFERRRLQLELMGRDLSLSLKAKSEKELRLEELTALIDGLTGGYLGTRLSEEKK